jgi:hypothetical protein
MTSKNDIQIDTYMLRNVSLFSFFAIEKCIVIEQIRAYIVALSYKYKYVQDTFPEKIFVK